MTAVVHHETKAKGHEKAEKAQGKLKDAKEHAERAHEEGQERAEEALEAVEDAGKGRGGELRARRDEGKAIKAEYEENAEPGTPRKGKKPWWRFWESDDEAETDVDESWSQAGATGFLPKQRASVPGMKSLTSTSTKPAAVK